MKPKKHKQRFDLSPSQDNLKHYEHIGLFTKGYVHGGMNRIRITPRWVERFLFFKIYLHEMIAPDPGDDLHDHPWKSLSIRLYGDIIEEHMNFTSKPINYISDGTDIRRTGKRKLVWPPRFMYRSPDYAHLIVGGSWEWGKPAWTLFITWGRKRDWGFWVFQRRVKRPGYSMTQKQYRWVPAEKYLKGEHKR